MSEHGTRVRAAAVGTGLPAGASIGDTPRVDPVHDFRVLVLGAAMLSALLVARWVQSSYWLADGPRVFHPALAMLDLPGSLGALAGGTWLMAFMYRTARAATFGTLLLWATTGSIVGALAGWTVRIASSIM